MKPIYMRSGDQEQYLHLSSCKRCTWLARLFRQVKPWPWADAQDQDRPRLIKVVMALDIKVCNDCRPLAGKHAARAA
jgi:hypothetical protein